MARTVFPSLITKSQSKWTMHIPTHPSQALERNSTLQTLDVRGNNIGDAGCRALAEVLKRNTTLTQLDLAGMPLPELLAMTSAAGRGVYSGGAI